MILLSLIVSSRTVIKHLNRSVIRHMECYHIVFTRRSFKCLQQGDSCMCYLIYGQEIMHYAYNVSVVYLCVCCEFRNEALPFS